MSELQREERYIVFKIKDLTLDETCDLRDYIAEQGIKTPECVVVESDWPNYEHVWQTIEQVANGTFDPDEIATAQAENEALRERLENYEALKRMHRLDNYPNELSAKAWLLRKQAEAMERAIDSSYGFTQMAQLLRTQARDLERQSKGGE